jgi:colicin import membrane protein
MARDYALAFLLALVVHAGVVLILIVGWSPSKGDLRVIKPKIVNAKLMVMERREVKAPVPQAPPKLLSKKELRPKPQPEASQARVPSRVDMEAARRQRHEAERQDRLRELAERAFEQALVQEAIDLVESVQEDKTRTYVEGIYETIVANWSRPPSARNDMEAKLLVELIPTGEVVLVTLLASSGNSAFDRSAEAAVRKSRRFNVPDEYALFEDRFRKFTLLFKPEDLLR